MKKKWRTKKSRKNRPGKAAEAKRNGFAGSPSGEQVILRNKRQEIKHTEINNLCVLRVLCGEFIFYCWVSLCSTPATPGCGFLRRQDQPSKRLNTRVALVPPKPKLLDITQLSVCSSSRSRTIGMPSASGINSVILAEAAMKLFSIINIE